MSPYTVPHTSWPQTYDKYSALAIQQFMYLNGGIPSMNCESFHTQNSPMQIHEAESEVLSVDC